MFKFFERFELASLPKQLTPLEDRAISQKSQNDALEAEVIRAAFKQLLRQQDIPPHWLTCEGVVIQYKNKVEKRCVHIVIKHWNEKLLHYAPALQKKLLQNMDLFDPKTDYSDYFFSWEFAPDIKYPISDLPGKVIWSDPEVIASDASIARLRSGTKQQSRAELEAQFRASEFHQKDFQDTDVL